MAHDHGGHVHDDMMAMHDHTTMMHDHAVNDMPMPMPDDGGGGHHMMDMMKMYFHGGVKETILFDWWKTDSVGCLIGSMIGIFIMAMLYEGVKYYREYLFWRTYNALQYRSVTLPGEKITTNEDTRVVQPRMLSWMHAYQTLLHVVQIIISYFLMLIFMTFNTWLCLSIVLGAAVGYFLFGWKKSIIVDVTEHCH